MTEPEKKFWEFNLGWKGCNQETGADRVETSPPKVKTIYEKCLEVLSDQSRKINITLENDKSSEVHLNVRDRRIAV